MKKICVIVNPSSGQSIQVVPQISKFLKDNTYSWEVFTTKKQGDALQFSRQAINNEADAVLVYGGDGTVMEASGALMNTNTPLYILPGGTANILAKELQIPLFLEPALGLLKDSHSKIRRIDMGTVNGHPFILRVSTGVLADMIIEADPEAKTNFGQLAYSFSALQQFANTKSIEYSITINGQTEVIEGITLTVANSGNIGFSGLSFSPEIKVDDGYLDIIVLRDNTFGSIAGVITDAIINRDLNDDLAHRRVKKAKISIKPPQSVLCDDILLNEVTLDIEVIPSAISVAVPL